MKTPTCWATCTKTWLSCSVPGPPRANGRRSGTGPAIRKYSASGSAVPGSGARIPVGRWMRFRVTRPMSMSEWRSGSGSVNVPLNGIRSPGCGGRASPCEGDRGGEHSTRGKDSWPTLTTQGWVAKSSSMATCCTASCYDRRGRGRRCRGRADRLRQRPAVVASTAPSTTVVAAPGVVHTMPARASADRPGPPPPTPEDRANGFSGLHAPLLHTASVRSQQATCDGELPDRGGTDRSGEGG